MFKVNLAPLVFWYTIKLNGGWSTDILLINDVVPLADEKLDVCNVCDDIFIFLIPSKFNGYNAVNVYNGVSADTYDVFKLNPSTLPIENVLSV